MKRLISLRRLMGPIALAVGLFVGVAACTGPPPPINHNLYLGINLHDPAGFGVSHLHVNPHVVVDSCGNVTSSTADLGNSSYGFINFFGTVEDAYPVRGGGTTGSNWGPCIRGWTNSSQYVVMGVFDVRVMATIGRIGYNVSKGWCVVTWPLIIISGGNQVDSQVYANLGQVRSSCRNGYYLDYST